MIPPSLHWAGVMVFGLSFREAHGQKRKIDTWLYIVFKK